MPSTKTVVASAVLGVAGILAAALALDVVLVLMLSLPFKWLWNALLPALISAPRVSFCQSVGLLSLITLLRWVITGAKIRAKLKTNQ